MHKVKNIELARDVSFMWYCATPYYKLDSEFRKYHNAAHASDVEFALFDIVEEPSTALILAARWHDAIYIPGAPDGVSENASAAMLMYNYHQLVPHHEKTEAFTKVIQTAAELIKATKVSNHLAITQYLSNYSWEALILLDADLSPLASDYFLENQVNICQEQGYEWGTETMKASAEFLKKMTSRKNIFRTPKGIELYEEKARYNIDSYIKEAEQL